MASTSSKPQITTVITHYVLLPAFVSLVAATRQNALVRLATLLGLVLLALHACQQYAGSSAADHSGDFLGSNGFRTWFASFLAINCFEAWWLLFYANLEDIRYKDDKVPMMERPLLSRMYCLWSLRYNQRGIGWSIESANLPSKPGPSRIRFLARKVIQLCHRLVLSDIVHVYRSTNPVFGLGRGDQFSVGSQGPIFRCLNILAFGANAYCVLSTPQIVLSIIAVASGFSEPCDWPDMFGNWSDAYSIRRFWNRVWHQVLRRVASSSATFTARHLGFVRGSWLSSRTQLLVGFSVTGLIHVFGDWILGVHGGSFPYFILQALGITFEDAVVDVAKKIHPKIQETRWTRMVGYLWTIAWLSWSTVMYADWFGQLGVTQPQPSFVVAPTMRLVGIDVYDMQHLYPSIIPNASN